MRPECFLDTCLRCGACAGICPVNAIRLGDSGPNIDHGTCIECMTCVRICPAGAMKEGGST